MTDPRIKTLADRIQAAKDAYYGPGQPIMSDAEYDALEDELRRLDPNHPVLAKVGAAPSSGWVKVKHEIPMGSLNKVQAEPDMLKWAQGTSSKGFVVMDKLDGASLSLHYSHGSLTRAVTRGDGITGEEVTPNAALIRGVVKRLPPSLASVEVDIRGEVMAFKHDFAQFFPGESNPRNTASGTLRRQTGNHFCRHLSFVAYDLYVGNRQSPSKTQELQSLRDAGFLLPRWAKASSSTEMEAIYQAYLGGVRDSLDYEIDGLVLAVDDLAEREVLGVTNLRPKGAAAYKFPHPEKPTVLRDIEWQVGASGRLTPVAIFDEVALAGVQVKRASLAGVRQLKHLRLFRGCRILVSRRNEVIPRVEANLDLDIENDL